MKKVLNLLTFLLVSFCNYGNNLVVLNTNDSGIGSLREAITIANSSTGADSIAFNIPTSDAGYNAGYGTWTITLNSLLPYILGGNIIIDGNSQAAYAGDLNPNGPEIIITTANPSTATWAFGVFTANNTIRGLLIYNFSYGILISETSGNNNTVTQNFLGVNYSGTSAAANLYGILIANNSYNNIIKDNLISGNTENGLLLTNSSGNIITGNKIGTDISGTIAIPNKNGVICDSSSSNIIGGYLISERNLISGNSQCGIVISSRTSTANSIRGNFIGTDISGTSRLPNLYGITITKSHDNIIGPQNLISGNDDIGVLLTGKYTRENSIFGNLIGTDITGTQLVYNDKGIVMKSMANSNSVGGITTAERNIISGNLEIGVYIEAADSNTITGNYIGTDITGMYKVAINNDSLIQGNGVEFNIVARHNILGGTTPAERNIISGHKVYGVVYYGHCNNNTTIGNFIGTDVTSKNSLPNATGICFDCASNHNDVINNVLSGNLSYGLFYVTRGTEYNRLLGNMIGVDSSGTMAVPNDIGMVVSTGTANNIIGGHTATERNIFSGNYLSGIMITNQLTEFNLIKGNYFGTDITGTQSIPNLYGVMFSTFCKHNSLDSNLISGNTQAGIIINEEADSNTIINNLIGTDVSGMLNLGNGSGGIYIDQGAKYNIIGQPETPNTIAFNGEGGILITHEESLYNTISGNSIFENEGLGIDISPFASVNANDTGDIDTGPQDLLNSPVIISATYDNGAGTSYIQGSIDCSDPADARIEIFIASPDSSGCGQGKTFIGYAIPDNSGNWHLAYSSSLGAEIVTATTIDKYGNTSEYSSNHTCIVGIQEKEDAISNVTLFPNPCTEYLTVNISGEMNVDFMYTVIDMQGRTIKSPVNAGKSQKVIYWDLRDDKGQKVSKGQYFINIAFSNGFAVSKSVTVL